MQRVIFCSLCVLRTAEKFRTSLAVIYALNYCKNHICMHFYFTGQCTDCNMRVYFRFPTCGHTFCLRCIASLNLAHSGLAAIGLRVSVHVFLDLSLTSRSYLPDFVSVLQLSVLLAATMNSGVLSRTTLFSLSSKVSLTMTDLDRNIVRL